MTTLVNKLFLWRPAAHRPFLEADSWLCHGHVVGQVSDEVYLVRLNSFVDGRPTLSHLVHLDEMVADFVFFERSDEDAWRRECERQLKIDKERLRELDKETPLDEESHRVTREHHDTLARKFMGKKNVRWSAEPRVRYMQCVQFHPKARVSVRQIGPVEDENIESQSLEFLDTYDKLLDYLQQHWDRHGRKAATYKWAIYDERNPQWASAKVEFRAESE